MKESEVLQWVIENTEVVEWLMRAVEDMKFGKLILVIHEKKITCVELRPRIRVEVKEGRVNKGL